MNKLNHKIPGNWQTKSFGEVFEFLPTLTLSRVDLNSDELVSGIYNIHYGDIHSTYNYTILDFEVEKKVPKIIDQNLDEAKLTLLKDGDLVIADASEDYEGVGTCIELKNIGNRKVTAGLHTFAAREKSNKLAIGFKGYLFKHPWVRNELKKLATGSKVYGVSKTNIAELNLVIPTLPEQQKIASILSKWDVTIEAQTQLIEAKENQKKGLMQKLLTGKVRFPGFEDEWEDETLNNILLKIVGGGTPSRLNPNYWGNEIYWCTVKDFTNFNPNRTQEMITNLGLKQSSSNVIPKGVLITPTRMAIGKVAVFNIDVAINQDLKALFFNDKVITQYMVHWFNFNSENIANLGTGSTVMGIKLDELRAIEITIPCIDEQQKIATFLSSLDEEILNLKTELESLKLQKKGLMQELLTGEIRVKA